MKKLIWTFLSIIALIASVFAFARRGIANDQQPLDRGQGEKILIELLAPFLEAKHDFSYTASVELFPSGDRADVKEKLDIEYERSGDTVLQRFGHLFQISFDGRLYAIDSLLLVAAVSTVEQDLALNKDGIMDWTLLLSQMDSTAFHLSISGHSHSLVVSLVDHPLLEELVLNYDKPKMLVNSMILKWKPLAHGEDYLQASHTTEMKLTHGNNSLRKGAFFGNFFNRALTNRISEFGSEGYNVIIQ